MALAQQIKKKWRFDVGDRVICHMGSKWVMGIVNQLDWYEKDDICYPYQVKLIEGSDKGKRLYVPVDTNDSIRKYHESPLEQIKQAIECQDDDEIIKELIFKHKNLDYSLPAVYTDLWLHIGKYGCEYMAEFLCEKKLFPWEVFDSNGRTVVHLAILNRCTGIFWLLE